MRAVIQRVKEAQVSVEGKMIGRICQGLLVLLAVSKKDSFKDADYFIEKLLHLRIFEDNEGKMNVSSLEAHAQFLIVSQFTLYGDCSNGRRPSFDEAAEPKRAEEIYNYFVENLRKHNSTPPLGPLRGGVETGLFRAMMEVSLVNDGPVTFILESK